jgi:CubicO group peptidase (beta-lactamase class C family)
MKYLKFTIPLFFLTISLSYGQIRTLSGRLIEKSAMDNFLSKQLDSLKIKSISIAVINDGRVVYHRTMGISNVYTLDKINDQTIFEAASISKPLFAFFVLRLVDKNILALDTPLYKYLPYPDIAYDNRYKLITARMVLDHTSGFPNWRVNDTLKIMFIPGTKFSYSGEGYEYLAKVVAYLAGCTVKNLDSLFQQEVAIPLNMKHSHFMINQYIAKHVASGHVGDYIVYESNEKDIFHSAGGLYSESIDYSKFLIALMNYKLLKKETEDEMLKQQVQLSADDNRMIQNLTGYGLGFFIKLTPYGIAYLHGGNNWGYTSSAFFNKERKFGYVFFTNTDQCNGLKLSIEHFLTD